jgi:starch phosphorylase
VIKRIAIIDEGKMIRVTNLCFVACHKIVFSTDLQFEILMKNEDSLYRDFCTFLPKKTFTIISNGGNPRRWIYNANRKLANLITEEIRDESEWLIDLEHLSSFVRYADDLSFLQRFLEVRASNKWRLLNWIKKKTH